ncbi:hypothetical protein F0562_030378 [Nyssa sinensis]|uniref:PB1 domain-containing protein n=1 Tax=Nyssa sinensis TaxID=561372 RepID=A0A5J5AW84_9ASTE|nr:hypothetical protein F0562_030378 [Nyssa sinensis]
MAEDTAVDFFMENLMELMNCDNEFILDEKDNLKSLYEELKFLRKFLKDTEEKREENIKVKDLVAKIRDVTFEAEKSVDLFVLDVVSESKSYMRLMCSSGGKILSHSDDNQLHYVGGDTRIVDVHRQICISSLLSSLSSIFDTSNFVIKYKLPNEDFDALITVTTDEDIDDLIKAYDRFAGCNVYATYETPGIELFLFSTEAAGSSASGISKVLDIPDRQPRDPELKIPHWPTQLFQENVEWRIPFRKRSRCSREPLFKRKFARPIRFQRRRRFSREQLFQNKVAWPIPVTESRTWLSDDGIVKERLHFPLDLTGVLEEIGSIKTEIVEIYGNKLYVVVVPQVKTFSHGSCSRTSAPNVEEETVVGFDHEVRTIKERLIGVSKQLEVISIVGMAGLGKTTLAKKLYNDPLVVYHFYIRGWTYVSQVFQKGDLLLGILSSFVQQKNEIYTMSNEQLGERLYKCLKGRRYLVVMDDIWHIEAWNDTKMYFPNDNNGSRILFTSRINDVALQAKPDSPPHFLQFLTDDESWDLLQKKVFQKTSCPTELVEIGKQIAKKCQGLPLAIVVVAGLLAKTEQTENWWKKVAESVSSYILNDPKQYIDTLALSYNHLPPHLKSCFLFMGAFPEDYEIPVQKLIWLWIAEGFIRQTGQKSKEDVAEEYLVDLIDRSLVLVAKRSAGVIKACHVHDLLRDLCLRKAEEDNFLLRIYRHEQLSSLFSSSPRQIRRLFIHSQVFESISLQPTAPYVRSFLCFSSKLLNVSFNIHKSFQLLRVLDLSPIEIPHIPTAIESLVHLRYLALQNDDDFVLSHSISKLSNLETLILIREGWKHIRDSFGDFGLQVSFGDFGLPDPFDDFGLPDSFGDFGLRHMEKKTLLVPPSIWKLVKLRHIQIPRGSYTDKLTDDVYPLVLDNLQTISHVYASKSFENILARTPNLKKLGFCGNLVSKSTGYFYLVFPDLSPLNYLETLKLSTWMDQQFFHSGPLDHYKSCVFRWVKFPPNLKKLTLEDTYLAWKEMSILGKIPNLEVLKLMHNACIGQRWETSCSRSSVDAGIAPHRDTDSMVLVTATRISLNLLSLAIKTRWYPWYSSNQGGGWTEVYDGLTFATVKEAGHEVPLIKPKRAFILFRSFLAGKEFPRS